MVNKNLASFCHEFLKVSLPLSFFRPLCAILNVRNATASLRFVQWVLFWDFCADEWMNDTLVWVHLFHVKMCLNVLKILEIKSLYQTALYQSSNLLHETRDFSNDSINFSSFFLFIIIKDYLARQSDALTSAQSGASYKYI